MPDDLLKLPFKPEYQRSPEIQSFNCGTEEWACEVADYIKGDEVLADIADPECEVWLYLNPEAILVGYSSLSRSNWRYPDLVVSKRVAINVLLMFGVAVNFQGLPKGDPSGTYAQQMMGHVLAQCLKRKEREPILALYVHPDNTKGQGFYAKKVGFRPFPKTWLHPTSGVRYQAMLLDRLQISTEMDL